MNRPRTIALTWILVMSVFLIQCGEDDVVAPNYDTEIDQNLAALGHLDQVEPFAERPKGDAKLETYEVDGRTYECSVQEFEIAAEYNEQLSLNPTSDILWPGSIIDGATIETGEYIPIIAPRDPITISISLENIAGEVSMEVKDPKLSTMRQAIRDILAQEVTGATPATVTYSIENVYSESQLDIALGVSYKSGLASVKGQFDFSNTEILSRTVVRFMQVYYSIDIDLPSKPSDLFAAPTTWGEIRSQISGDVSPMYVSTISYGRMALFTMESSYSSTQVSTALEASFKAINTNVDLEVGYKEVLAKSSIKATIIGGSGSTAVLAINGFDGLKDWVTQGGDYDKNSPGAPLAYKLRYVCDNATCRVVMANNYFVRTCEELVDGHYGIKHAGAYVAWFYVYYTLDGEPKEWYSGKYTSGFTRSVDIPARATDVAVRAREDTGFGYRTIFRYPAVGGTPKPEVKCWRVAGWTLGPTYSEITCDF